MRGPVAAAHSRIAGEWGATGQGEQEPQHIVREPEREVEHDVIRVVEARRQPEIGDVPGVSECDQSAPHVENRTAPWTTRKGRAWVQMEQSHDSHVERVEDHQRGGKVIQLLC